MQEEFGYPALTPAIKDRILAHNAAAVYGVDLDAARAMVTQRHHRVAVRGTRRGRAPVFA